jgi:CubicO group peptidase (beta-lactamase class C family)
LGITEAEWTLGRNGDAAAAAGLRLRPRELAKIGQLVLNQGRCGERQLVPIQWLEQSFKQYATTSGGEGYGYQWWLGQNAPTQKPYVAGMGNGGQRLYILPALDIVAVTTAGNYNSVAAASRLATDLALATLV